MSSQTGVIPGQPGGPVLTRHDRAVEAVVVEAQVYTGVSTVSRSASGAFSGRFQQCPLSLCPLPYVGRGWVEVTSSGPALAPSDELGEIPALPAHS